MRHHTASSPTSGVSEGHDHGLAGQTTKSVASFMEGHCVDHDDHDEEDEDDGDEWIKSLEPCSREGIQLKHLHIKIAVDEKLGKTKLF